MGGFIGRMQSGSGRFVTSEELERLKPYRLSDALMWNADYVTPVIVSETIDREGLSETVLGTFGPYTTILPKPLLPVGRLVLYLGRCCTPENAELSDSVCTGLQLANFWQDVARDWDRGRIYLPAEDLERFGVTEASLAAGVCDDRFKRLMQFEIDRAREDRPALDSDIRAAVLSGRRTCDRSDCGRDRPEPESPPRTATTSRSRSSGRRRSSSAAARRSTSGAFSGWMRPTKRSTTASGASVTGATTGALARCRYLRS